jgi:hypothetical protein
VQLDKSSFDATVSYNNCDDAIAPVFPEEVNVFCTYSDDSTGDEPSMPQADELDHEAFDEYLDAQVVYRTRTLLPLEQSLRVKRIAMVTW